MKKLVVIADWASDSLTCQEFNSALCGYLKSPAGARVSFVASTPSTIHTSFLISQIVRTEERYGLPQQTVIFQNTDPRIQTDEAVEKAKGAEFIVIRLKNGMFLCGPNAGYDFAMISDQIQNVYHYPGLDKGSQFRSRDLYSRVSAHLMDELEDELELEEAQLSIVPRLAGMYVAHMDNYGNIKTTITEADLKGKFELHDELTITLNGVKKKVTYVSNLFGGTPGQLVIYPGSSGQKDNPLMEISVWRHFTEKNPTTGLHEFAHPRPGQEIVIG